MNICNELMKIVNIPNCSFFAAIQPHYKTLNKSESESLPLNIFARSPAIFVALYGNFECFTITFSFDFVKIG